MKALIYLVLITTAHANGPKKIDENAGNKLVQNKQCELQVSFGSYGSGTPRDVIANIDKYLKTASAHIKQFYSWHSGMEGELDYCLKFNDKSTLTKAHQAIGVLIPKESRKGYTTLKLNGLETHKTIWPKSWSGPVKIEEGAGNKLVQDKQCELQISFGSYSTGTPGSIIVKVDEYLRSVSDSIKHFYSWYWGDEGDKDYCLKFKDEAPLTKAHKAIAALIPKKRPDHGYAILKFKGLETDRTP